MLRFPFLEGFLLYYFSFNSRIYIVNHIFDHFQLSYNSIQLRQSIKILPQLHEVLRQRKIRLIAIVDGLPHEFLVNLIDLFVEIRLIFKLPVK